MRRGGCLGARGLRGLVVGKRRDPEGKRGVGGAEACSRKPGVGALCRETGCEREERYVISSPMIASNTTYSQWV